MTRKLFALAAALVLTSAAAAQDFSVKEGDGFYEFRDGDKVVTRYHVRGFTKPIFYPVNAPCGVPLTRAWPIEPDDEDKQKDHPWQKSAWFVYGDVVAEGTTLKNVRKGLKGSDFWSDGLKGCGKIVCTKVEIAKKDKDRVVLSTKNDWISADGDKILDETRTITLHKLKDAWLVVCDVDLSAPKYDIVFDDTKEGAFGIRINERITGKSGKGKIENAEGKVGEKACWGQISPWCDYSGPIDGKLAGLTVFTDPKNPHPSCWHVREYGLMAANPFGREKSGFPAMKGRTDVVRLAKGEHVHLRFGMLLHDGNAATGRVAEQYRRFVELRGK